MTARFTKILLVSLTLLCLGLIWLLCFKAEGLLPLWVPAAATGAVAALVVGRWLLARWQARRAASGLDSMFKEQAQQQAQLTRPDLQLELADMQKEFDRAITTLKGKGGRRDTLYRLPWYAIIGPPGCGKSTALRNSGLSFPFLGSRGGAVKGVGGTRNCDWWLANEGIVLDTAGRWTTEDEDREEWLGFLGLVKKHRPRKPLNGLITTVSVGEVARATDAELDQLARKMRSRVDEVIAELGISLPIYLLFTKCDLVEGFVETFGDLRRAERDRVWGFTVPLTEDSGEAGAYAEKRFAELSHVLRSRSLSRMGDERSADMRRAIYGFPQQYDLMRRNLVRFVSLLFEHNAYQETPILRGAYFTSGTQEGRPFNLLVERLSERLSGSVPRGAQGPAPVDQKSYFLHDAFMKVIFEDRDIASASQVEYSRMRARHGVLAGALAAGAVCFTVGPWLAHSQRSSALQETRLAIGAAAKIMPPQNLDLNPALAVETVDRVRAARALHMGQVTGSLLHMGMYRGGTLEDPLRELQAALVHRHIVTPIMEQLNARMKLAAAELRAGNGRARRQLYEDLKLHLLMTNIHAQGADALWLEDGDSDGLRSWVHEHLTAAGTAMQACGPIAGERLQRVISEYLELATARPDWFQRQNGGARAEDTVTESRAVLNARSAVDRAIEEIESRVGRDKELTDLTLTKMIGASQNIKTRDKHASVPSAYTSRAWESTVRGLLAAEHLDDELLGDRWVLGGHGGVEDPDQFRRAVASSYFCNYQDVWHNFVWDIFIDTAGNDDPVALLSDLTAGSHPPLERLLARVQREVTLSPWKGEESLTPGQRSLLEQVKSKASDWTGGRIGGSAQPQQVGARSRADGADADTSRTCERVYMAEELRDLAGFAVPPPVEEGEKPLPVDSGQYHASLEELRSRLLEGKPDEATTLAKSARASATAMAKRRDDPSVRTLLEAWLTVPIDQVSGRLHGDKLTGIGQQWCDFVYQPFKDSVASAYPSDPRAAGIPLSTFTGFFHPRQGAVYGFANDVLPGRIERRGERHVEVKTAGAGSDFTPAFLSFLDKAREVGVAFFPLGAEAPRIDMEVKFYPVPGVDRMAFSLGGKRITYDTAISRWQPISWPGDEPELGAAWEISGQMVARDSQPEPGEWGFFKLIERRGKVTVKSAREFSVSWIFFNVQGSQQTWRMDVRLPSSYAGPSPFFGTEGKRGLLAWLSKGRVRPPQAITTAGGRCR